MSGADIAPDVAKSTGKPSIPDDMAERVIAAVKQQYQACGENQAALGRWLMGHKDWRNPLLDKYSGASVAKLLNGDSKPSFLLVLTIAKQLNVTYWDLLNGTASGEDVSGRALAELKERLTRTEFANDQYAVRIAELQREVARKVQLVEDLEADITIAKKRIAELETEVSREKQRADALQQDAARLARQASTGAGALREVRKERPSRPSTDPNSKKNKDLPGSDKRR